MSDAESLCREIYRETELFYEQIRPEMKEKAFGYKIMYGPPVMNAPVLFIGHQPGGSAEDDKREQADGAHQTWRPELEYATEPWKLATIMRKIFDVNKLKACAGLNAIFFRAPDDKIWEKFPQDLRRRVETFCVPRVIKIIQALKPVRIVCIGFKALDLFGRSQPDLLNEKGRRLTKTSVIAGIPAIGTLHLSGARISNLDLDRIAKRVGLLAPNIVL